MSPSPERASARSIPWHPFVFAAIVVITAWLDSAISPYAVVRSLVVSCTLAGLLLAACALVLRSAPLGGIAATVAIWVLWSKQLLDVWATATERLGPFAIAWVLVVAVAVVVAARIVRRSSARWTPQSVTVGLNRASGFLLAATLVLGILNGTLPSLLGDLRQGIDLDAWAGSEGEPAQSEPPDIYAILLDGYPRADVLDHAFGLDNSAFTDALAERGFEVEPSAHSDYIWTHVTLPSALNMAYVEQIPSLSDVVADREPQQPAVRHAIANNEAFRVARERGYDTVAIASGFEEVSARQADVWVDGGQMTEFEVSLLASTWVGDILALLAPDLASGQQRERIWSNLDALSEIAATPDRPPALVFAHIPAPHQPVVFGADGTPVAVPISESFYADSPSERGEDPAAFRERYRAHLPYLNERVVAAIDAVIAASAQPPIIVLFADHGSASRTDWNTVDPSEADPAALLERTGTLFAALSPDEDDVYPDDVSPVDLFRLMFDRYFGTEYGRAVPPEDGGQIEPVDAAVLDE